ncbi:MAG: hypothetical protein ABRQ24_06530 [Syntrophomonadaceae bacterium]
MAKLQVLDVKTSSHGLIFQLSDGQEVGYWEAVDMVNRDLLSAEHVNDGNPDKVRGGDQHRLVDMDDLPEPEFPLRDPQ